MIYLEGCFFGGCEIYTLRYSGTEPGCFRHARVGIRVPNLVVFGHTRVGARVPNLVILVDSSRYPGVVVLVVLG